MQRAMSRRPRLGPRIAERRFVLAAIVPALLFYIVFRFYPLGYAFWISLHDWRLLSPTQTFIGINNYLTIFSDPLFLKVIRNTFFYAFATSFFSTVLGFLLAVLLNPIGRGSTLFRLLYFLPVTTSIIAISTVWLWLYQPRFGLLNYLLGSLGLPRVSWLTTPQTAMLSLVLMSVWAGVGFNMIVFLAGLRGIPRTFYEAAAIDGASGRQSLWHVTLPLIGPVLTFVFITSLIAGFNVFQQVYLMTKGGPLDSTRVLALQIYEYAFQRRWMGQATSMAFVLFAVVLGLTLVQLWLRRIDWEY